MAWLGSGRVVNPAIDQVLVDTGALPYGSMTFMVKVAATVAAAFEIQHRNAANNANITGHTQILAVPASGQDSIPETTNFSFMMAEGERLRIVQVAAVTGSVSVSLFYAG